MKVELLFTFILLSHVWYSDGFSSGAPNTACMSMTPVHGGGIEPQRTSPPYSVSAVKSADKIKVTINSQPGDEFQGFIIQARSSKDKSRIVDGKFTKQNGISKFVNCFNKKENTLTHTDPNPKSRIITEWTPASGVNEDVIFRATVAKTYDKFWIDIYSSPVSVRNNHHGDNSGITHKDESESTSNYEDCFISKGCFGYPQNCIERQDCEVLLSYVYRPEGISFKISGFLESNNYIALGISEDILMGDDSVTECFKENGRIIARESWNERRNNNPIKEIPEGLFQTEDINGVISCSWVKPYVTEVNGKTFNLANSTYYLLLAKGPMTNRRLRQHVGRIASQEKVNFTAFEMIESEGVSDSVKIHGTFMVTAWVGLVSLAILLARHFKSVWENHTLFGVKIWFAFHRGLMILALGFVVVAFIVIFVYKNGWDYGNSNPHAILGCIATALGLFQPIMAAFRPAPDHPNRPIFNWLHWAVGNTAQIIAVITIFFAVTLEGSGLKESFYWVMAIFVIVHCIFHFLFQLHSWTNEKKKNNEIKMLELNQGRGNNTIQNNFQDKNFSGNIFRVLLLGVYGIFLAVIMMALYALIGIA